MDEEKFVEIVKTILDLTILVQSTAFLVQSTAFKPKILRVVQTQAILFLNSLSARVGSDIERL